MWSAGEDSLRGPEWRVNTMLAVRVRHGRAGGLKQILQETGEKGRVKCPPGLSTSDCRRSRATSVSPSSAASMSKRPDF